MYRIALKMLVGNATKYLGLIFGVAFATLLMAQQSSIFCGLMLRTASIIRDVREAEIWVMDPRVHYIEEVEPLSDMDVFRVRGIDGVQWAAGFYKGMVNARSTDGIVQQVYLLGVDDATMTGAPRHMLLGSVEDLKRPDALIIDQAGYEYLWPGEPLRVGRTLELNDRRAVVVGVCDSLAPFTTFPVCYTRYSQAMSYVPDQRRKMSFVLARTEPGVDAGEVCARITAETGLRARTSNQFVWDTIDHYLRRTGIPVNFGITVLLGFLVGAAIAGQTFYMFTIENLRQFGALKAIGVGNGTILGMVLLQATVVGVLGYALGVGVAAVFFEVTSRLATAFRGMHMNPEVMVLTAAAVLLIVVIASVASVRKVLVLDPAVVFRG